MKRAIVTGATGVVGTALIEELVKHQIEVLVFCHKGSRRNVQILKHPLVKKKEYSLECFSDMQNDTGKSFDVFYHFAWAGTTGEARNDVYLQNQNVHYSLDAVRVAKCFGCHTFVGAGSQAEYGRVEGVLKPDTPAFPETGYGIGKLCAGQLTREYAHQIGMKHIWTRILSVYGPNDNEQSMIMSTIRKLLKDEIPRLTKGEQMWDYLYGADAAKAFRLLGEKGKDGKTYVLGGGKARQLSEYIEIIRDIVKPGAEMALGAVPYAKRQVMHLEADISALREDTGFCPEYDFDEGIRNIVTVLQRDAL